MAQSTRSKPVYINPGAKRNQLEAAIGKLCDRASVKDGGRRGKLYRLARETREREMQSGRSPEQANRDAFKAAVNFLLPRELRCLCDQQAGYRKNKGRYDGSNRRLMVRRVYQKRNRRMPIPC